MNVTNLEKAKLEIIEVMKKYNVDIYPESHIDAYGDPYSELFLEEQFKTDGKFMAIEFRREV